jgi:hypothetical protein
MMGRIDFGRESFARPHELDEDYIPSVSESSFVDDNSPLSDTEVRFGDNEADRPRSIHLDWHNNMGERELEIIAGYNSVRRELLNDALKETMAVHGQVKTLTVTLAIPNARVHVRFFQEHAFERVADRSRKTWSFSSDIEEQKLRKKERKPRASRVVDIKPEPKPDPKTELKPLMTVSEYQNKTAELDALRSRIKNLEDGGAT